MENHSTAREKLGAKLILYPKLIDMRGKGRYLGGGLSITEEDAQLLLDRVKSMRDEAQSRIKTD